MPNRWNRCRRCLFSGVTRRERASALGLQSLDLSRATSQNPIKRESLCRRWQRNEEKGESHEQVERAVWHRLRTGLVESWPIDAPGKHAFTCRVRFLFFFFLSSLSVAWVVGARSLSMASTKWRRGGVRVCLSRPAVSKANDLPWNLDNLSAAARLQPEPRSGGLHLFRGAPFLLSLSLYPSLCASPFVSFQTAALPTAPRVSRPFTYRSPLHIDA